MKKAIVLLSGGQDSTTCLYWALSKHFEVHAIGFNYGQRHKVELEMAEKIAQKAGVPYTIFDVKGIFQNSSLVDMNQDVNAPHSINKNLPSSFTAGRNLVFLSIATGFAYNIGAQDIITGVCQTDFSGYPDCRQSFINAMEHAASLAVDQEIYIHTPLMQLTKAETWKLAKTLDIVELIINDTMTDYNGDMTMNEWGRGIPDSPSNKLRVAGFYHAKEMGWL